MRFISLCNIHDMMILSWAIFVVGLGCRILIQLTPDLNLQCSIKCEGDHIFNMINFYLKRVARSYLFFKVFHIVSSSFDAIQIASGTKKFHIVHNPKNQTCNMYQVAICSKNLFTWSRIAEIISSTYWQHVGFWTVCSYLFGRTSVMTVSLDRQIIKLV